MALGKKRKEKQRKRIIKRTVKRKKRIS